MRRTLIAGNWKMHGNTATNAELLNGILAGLNKTKTGIDIAVCVPAPYVAQCHTLLQGSAIQWGGQDISAYDSGAYTGEVAASMLADFGCRYTIVGHSERRTLHAESDTQVAQKTLAALQAGITPIVCVGETLTEREANNTVAVVYRQLDEVLAVLDGTQAGNIVIAYEPVWAIGTGKTATPEMAQEVHALLRARVAQKNPVAAKQLQILYGGSMKPENAAQLLNMADIDGGLIGGASLKIADFLAIIHAA